MINGTDSEQYRFFSACRNLWRPDCYLVWGADGDSGDTSWGQGMEGGVMRGDREEKIKSWDVLLLSLHVLGLPLLTALFFLRYISIIVTSAIDGEGGYVFTPLCLHAGYLKKLWTDLYETWWTSWEWDHDKMIRFWWRSDSGSGYESYLIL